MTGALGIGCAILFGAFGVVLAAFVVYAFVEPWIQNPGSTLTFYVVVGAGVAVFAALYAAWDFKLRPYLQKRPARRIGAVGLLLALFFDVAEKAIKPPQVSAADVPAFVGWALETIVLILFTWVFGFVAAGIAYMCAELYVHGRWISYPDENWLERNPRTHDEEER